VLAISYAGMWLNNSFREQSGEPEAGTMKRLGGADGFTLVEVTVVLIIVFVLAALAIPSIVSSVRTAHLRGAASDFSGLLEQARISAIRDNRYYSTYILTASGNQAQQAYVDLLPKSLTGASGNGGTSVAAGDPSVAISSDVTQQPVDNAPNTDNLKSQLLPSTTSVTPTDTSVTAATFGPRGLPCTPIALTGGTVCDSSGGPTAFWTFFQNSTTGAWQAVTITPAGRIKKWFYNGSAWTKL
jgi:Tfp pilus assembly protein FimT